jgi:glycosyltransferase involved in cell wall biosynthesis
MASVVLIVPGRLETRTGGYEYDRRIVQGLRTLGWRVDVRELDESFPAPTAAARDAASVVLDNIPDRSTVLLDGLALGVLPDEAGRNARRVNLVALVHHPLAAETALEPGEAARLRESERRALESAAAVVVTSRPTAAMMPEFGVSQERVFVIEPGTDAAPLARGSGGPDVHLLCVATLIPRKGHDVLVRALADLRPEGGSRRSNAATHRSDGRIDGEGGWRLTCVGSLDRHPETVAALRAQLAAAGLSDRVSLVGELESTALARCYDEADVFVLPTRFEGYGMVVAEALAHGLPVVATSTGAIGELVGDEAGVLVPPGDAHALSAALARVIADAEWRARLAGGARRVRERLPTWEHSSAQMAVVLEQVTR